MSRAELDAFERAALSDDWIRLPPGRRPRQGRRRRASPASTTGDPSSTGSPPADPRSRPDQAGVGRRHPGTMPGLGRDARAAESARLESVCGATHRGFESHSLRKYPRRQCSPWSDGHTTVRSLEERMRVLRTHASSPQSERRRSGCRALLRHGRVDGTGWRGAVTHGRAGTDGVGNADNGGAGTYVGFDVEGSNEPVVGDPGGCTGLHCSGRRAGVDRPSAVVDDRVVDGIRLFDEPPGTVTSRVATITAATPAARPTRAAASCRLARRVMSVHATGSGLMSSRAPEAPPGGVPLYS